MQRKENNYAHIDGANLHKGAMSLGWRLDYKRFRVWLSEKYGVQKAYLFIGLIPKYSDLYKHLQECGYTLVFKQVVYDSEGKPKGNCDADLVCKPFAMPMRIGANGQSLSPATAITPAW